jgi:hypothetical protein
MTRRRTFGLLIAVLAAAGWRPATARARPRLIMKDGWILREEDLR